MYIHIQRVFSLEVIVTVGILYYILLLTKTKGPGLIYGYHTKFKGLPFMVMIKSSLFICKPGKCVTLSIGV